MDDRVLLSGWKLLAYSGGSMLVLGIWLFRLDELLVRRKRKPGKPKRPRGHDSSGGTTFTDPDGTVWRPRKK